MRLVAYFKMGANFIYSIAVVKLMRILVALRDAHFEKYLTKKNLLEPILDLVIETMPKDNLLNSACLEFFEFIKRVREPDFICLMSYPQTKDGTYRKIFGNMSTILSTITERSSR